MEPVKLEPGVYQMPDEHYFALDAVSNSDLKQVIRSPAHYRAYKDNPEEQKDTPDMFMGRALHCTVLEPEEFFNRYAILPATAPNKPTKAQLNAKNPAEKSVEAITFWHEFKEKAGDKDILTAIQADEYLKIGEIIRNHPELKNLLSGGMAERVVIAEDPVTGELCRCKTDYAVKLGDLRVIIDLKSAEDARPEAFQRNAYKYGYFNQAPFYSDIWEWAGYPIDLWIFAVFEKTAPYAVKLYEVLPDDMERGRAVYRMALNTFAECKATNTWPSYSTEIEQLYYPSWAKD